MNAEKLEKTLNYELILRRKTLTLDVLELFNGMSADFAISILEDAINSVKYRAVLNLDMEFERKALESYK